MKPYARPPLYAAALGLVSLLVLDGWIPLKWIASRQPRPPAALRQALDALAANLADRAEGFSRRPEVIQSLAGGGIAVNRLILFSAAKQALENAPEGSWIVLTDPAGQVQAWWGDAPSSPADIVTGNGPGVRWSATTITVACRRTVGPRSGSGAVYAARTLPALAPDFGGALGLSGRALAWEPVAARSPSSGLADFRRAPPGEGTSPGRRPIALAIVLASGFFLIGRVKQPWRVGTGLVLIVLGLEAGARAGSQSLASAPLWAGAVGVLCFPLALSRLRSSPGSRRDSLWRMALGFALLLLSFFAAAAITPPELGTSVAGSLPVVLRLAGIALLVATGLVLSSCARSRPPSGAWMTAAILVTPIAIVAALAFVSPSPVFIAAVVALAIASFEAWSRAIASPLRSERSAVPRLLAATVLLTVLVVSPLAERARAEHLATLSRSILLPDPVRASREAAFEAERAVDHARRFDLARDLPAPVEQTDFSDLAYRLWREDEVASRSPALISYRVFDSSDALRSSFSLIPERPAGDVRPAGRVTIEHYEVAVVRRTAVLSRGGRPWGRVDISVADWPGWDPLPPRIDVYRRLVLGERAGGTESRAETPRPFLATYARDGEKRDEGPTLPTGLRARLRRSDRPMPLRLRFRGEDLWGEIRPIPEGYLLVAVPGPDFLGRLLTAALLLPAIAFLAGAIGLLALWRIATMPRGERAAAIPLVARTFRGRLVFLFVVVVMIPLVAVALFLRSAILTHSQRDTLDHARTALSTARRVLDDYLPSVPGPDARLAAVDDTLLIWLSNAVGYDLSVYAPDSTLVATSRRDLYAAGLVPDRVPGPAFVATGLGGGTQFVGSRMVSGGRIDEITTGLASVPGVPGVQSPALLSLMLLPQQSVARAEASQLTAAVSAFSLLVFLLSAVIAGRLAVRVARPVADLVAGTRAVALGISPHVPEPPDEELKELVRAFLSMSRSLRERTDALSAEKERLATLLAHLTAGVVAYRESGEVLLANPAAATLGGGSFSGLRLEEVFPGDAMAEVRRVLSDPSESFTPVEVEPHPGERWRIVTVSLPLGGEGVTAGGHRGRLRRRALEPSLGLGRDGPRSSPTRSRTR